MAQEESDTDRLTRLRIEVAKGNMTVRREGGSLVFEPVPAAPASEERRRLPMAEDDVASPPKPRKRGDCASARGEREDGTLNPCPWVSCAWHLALDVEVRHIRVVAPSAPDDADDLNLEAMSDTCALDVADRGAWRINRGMNGGLTHDEIGVLMRLSGERVRQLERTGSNKYKAGMRARGMAPEDDGRDFKPRPKTQYEIESDEEEETAAPKAPRVMRGTLFDATEEWQAAERSRVAKAPKKSEPKREAEPETTGTLALFGNEGEW